MSNVGRGDEQDECHLQLMDRMCIRYPQSVVAHGSGSHSAGVASGGNDGLGGS
jgi:hypothetical protein